MVIGLMTKNKDEKSGYKGTAAFYIVKMLEGIPEDLVDLFTPGNKDELIQLEINIVMWLTRSKEREKVIQLQKYHGLPLRPNQSLRDVKIYAKIAELKKRKYKNNGGDYPSLDKGNSGI